MNIHEYQAKAVLRAFGVPIASGFPAFTPDEAVEARRKLPGPLWVVKSQIHAGGRGKGRFKEAVGRRQRRRAARPLGRGGRDFRNADAGGDAGDGADRPGRQAGQPPVHRGRRDDRPGTLSLGAGRPRRRAASPSSSRPRAASTSRMSRTTRRKRSTPSPSIRRPGSCPITAAPPPARWA